MRQKKGSPSIGRRPRGNVCAGVLAQRPGKAETVDRTCTLHNSSRKMNLVRLTNCHSVEGELTMSAGRLMDTLRLSLEVTSSWMIREVGRFDWFDFYHKLDLTRRHSGGVFFLFFLDRRRTNRANRRLKILKNRYSCVFYVSYKIASVCVLIQKRASCRRWGSAVVARALKSSVTVSNKGNVTWF